MCLFLCWQCGCAQLLPAEEARNFHMFAVCAFILFFTMPGGSNRLNENENRTPFGVCHGLGGFTHTDPTWIILLGRQFVDRIRR
jgi:hypothetical protein